MPSTLLAPLEADLEFAGASASISPRMATAPGSAARAFLALGLTGLVLPICHLVWPSTGVELWELTLFLATCCGATGWYARGGVELPARQNASALAKKDWLPWAGTVALCLLAAALVNGARFWGVPARVALAAGFVGVGLLCGLVGTLDRTRRAWLGLGGAFGLLGLVWTTLPAGLWNSAFGVAFCAGGLSAAAISSWQAHGNSEAGTSFVGRAHDAD